MKVSITIITVVAFATLTSAASNEFQERIANLQSTLTSTLEKASNEKVSDVAIQALKTLKTAALAGETEMSVKAVAKIEVIVPSLDNMMKNGPATRSNIISTLTSLVGERKELLGSVLTQASEDMKKGGNGPWASILKVASEAVRNQILSNENVKNLTYKAADALDMIEDAIALLNDFSGGMHPLLNMAANAISTLDSASDVILDREKDDDTKNVIVSKLISMLYKMKNANNQAAFDALHKVCDKMHAAQKNQAN